MGVSGGNRQERRGRRQRLGNVGVKVTCVGGPSTVQSTKVMHTRRRLDLPQELEDGSTWIHRYELRKTRTGVEYHYRGSAELS